MDSAGATNHKDIQQNNYVTIVPVEYPSNRIYNQNGDYVVEQYR